MTNDSPWPDLPNPESAAPDPADPATVLSAAPGIPLWRLFDATWYAHAHAASLPGNPDPAELRARGFANLYDHFLREGAAQGRTAHPLFDAAIYRAGLADEPGAAAAIDAMGAWHHFIARIWFDGRDAVTSPYFDPDWFLASYPDAAAELAGGHRACALHAYLAGDAGLYRNPLPQFDEAWYLGHYPDAAAAVRDGRLLSG